MGSFEHETISMDDLRAGFGKELLAEAEVIIAVDADGQEAVQYGEAEWEVAVESGHEAELSVLRVEVGATDDVDELREMIAAVRSDTVDEPVEEPVDDDDG